jgi:hypothetical protein
MGISHKKSNSPFLSNTKQLSSCINPPFLISMQTAFQPLTILLNLAQHAELVHDPQGVRVERDACAAMVQRVGSALEDGQFCWTEAGFEQAVRGCQACRARADYEDTHSGKDGKW